MSKSSKGISKIGMIALAIVAIAIVIGLVAVSQPTNKASIVDSTYLSLISPIGGSVVVGQPITVTWTSGDSVSPTISLNILRKVSDNPNSYELVRTVSASTKNDGKAVWVPNQNDMGDNILVEVGCTETTNECHASQSGSQIAVNSTGSNMNSASVYEAIEASENN